MNVLALDFDGVICDSAREIFRVGARAYATFFPDSPLVRTLDPAGGGVAVPGGTTFAAFVDLIPLGNRAEDFGVALRAIEAQKSILDQASYDAFYAAIDPAWLREFHVRFYEQRAALRDADLEAWLALHAPFQRFTGCLERLASRLTLAIATAKDGTSVRLLLGRFGIAALFPDELVLDKDTGIHKSDHLQALASRLGVDCTEITFIDDKVNHLQRVARLGVRPVLAGWGYNSERERALARRQGITVATLDDAERVLLEVVDR